MFWDIFLSKPFLTKLNDKKEILNKLRVLEDICIDNFLSMEWWSYTWCYRQTVQQFHFDNDNHSLMLNYNLGHFSALESSTFQHVYRDISKSCYIDELNEKVSRYVNVNLECCDEETSLASLSRISVYSDVIPVTRFHFNPYYIGEYYVYFASIEEPQPCRYVFTMCTNLVCKNPPKRSSVATTQNIPEQVIPQQNYFNRKGF
jgi:hypothetical protein